MNVFTIKDLENLTGIKAHTIRIWEQRYSFLKPRRTDTNIRYYSADELRNILNIALLNKFGFKISHIGKLSEAEINEKILSLTQVQASQELAINQLIQLMVQGDMEKFEHTLDEHIASRGIEKTILLIIFPFLEKIGLLWMTNHIVPAQERLASNIIRQKIMIGIESIRPQTLTNKGIVLFLPEGEYHELVMLYLHFLLKRKGAAIWYLGTSVPPADLAFVANLKKPHYAYTYLSLSYSGVGLQKLIDKYLPQLEKTTLVISGRIPATYKKPAGANIDLRPTLAEMVDHIGCL